MAIRSVNGLDTLTQPSDFFLSRGGNDFTSFSGIVDYLPAGGVLGGGALRIASGAYINGGATSGTQGILGWFKLPVGFTDTSLYRKWAGTASTQDARVLITAAGAIEVYRADSNFAGTIFPAGTIEADKWYYFCISHVHADPGTVTVRINAIVATVGPTDFFDSTGVRVRYFEGGEIDVDDICLVSGDETALPPQVIYTLSPDSNNTPQDFSFTGGSSAWDSISEKVPDDDTSYISSDTVGHISKFNFESLPVGVVNIKALQGYGIASREASGGTNNVRTTIKTAAEATVGTVDVLLSDGVYATHSPGVSETAYSPLEINGMNVEFEVIF